GGGGWGGGRGEVGGGGGGRSAGRWRSKGCGLYTGRSGEANAAGSKWGVLLAPRAATLGGQRMLERGVLALRYRSTHESGPTIGTGYGESRSGTTHHSSRC